MNGRAYEPDLIVGWPTAEISVMGPEGAVNIIFRKQIEAAGDADGQAAVRDQLVATVREQIGAEIAAGWSFVDDLIDPADTRATVVRGLEIGEAKKVERPWRKHGVIPV
jgi:acetyl-CoA carboxylase carboxyltransferase component